MLVEGLLPGLPGPRVSEALAPPVPVGIALKPRVWRTPVRSRPPLPFPEIKTVSVGDKLHQRDQKTPGGSPRLSRP